MSPVCAKNVTESSAVVAALPLPRSLTTSWNVMSFSKTALRRYVCEIETVGLVALLNVTALPAVCVQEYAKGPTPPETVAVKL